MFIVNLTLLGSPNSGGGGNVLYKAIVDNPALHRKAVNRLQPKNYGVQIILALRDLKLRVSYLRIDFPQ